MNRNTRYWVWLQQKLGYGGHGAWLVMSMPGGVERVYGSDARELREMGCFTSNQVSKLEDKSLADAERIIRDCEALGYSIVTPDDCDYPSRLRNIYDSPAALYVSGTLPEFDDEAAVAMIGTRRASAYGITIAEELAERLADSGVLIVSGGAPGIDSASHRGALRAGGKTVAVLGCGINYAYNLDGAAMRREILRYGALVSEYPPGYAAIPRNFPLRNRLISGLSLGVVVVEAGEKSGSLITVDCALEQGKDVFAIPGRIGETCTVGTNQMLHDGAMPVVKPYDVIGEYIRLYPHRLRVGTSMEPLSAEPRTSAKQTTRAAKPAATAKQEKAASKTPEAPAAVKPQPAREASVNEPKPQAAPPHTTPPRVKSTGAGASERTVGNGGRKAYVQIHADAAIMKNHGAEEPAVLPRKTTVSVPSTKAAEERPAAVRAPVPAPPKKEKAEPPAQKPQAKVKTVMPKPSVEEESSRLIDDMLVQYTFQSQREQLPEKALLLLDVLSGTPQTAGDLMKRSGLSISETMCNITELEMLGLLEALPGGRYVRAGNDDGN